MGCNCKGKANIAYSVTFGPGGGQPQKFESLAAAQAALKQAGNPAGATVRAVPA